MTSGKKTKAKMAKWKVNMFNYFGDCWNDGYVEVVLYLLGGHIVIGKLDFKPGSDEKLTLEDRDRILEEARVPLTVDGRDFFADESVIVAYATTYMKD